MLKLSVLLILFSKNVFIFQNSKNKFSDCFHAPNVDAEFDPHVFIVILLLVDTNNALKINMK